MNSLASRKSLTEQQRTVLDWIAEMGEPGVTVKDLREQAGCHHGQASGLLSRLHQRGLIACLASKRGEYHVYVAPRYVNNRDTIKPGELRPANTEREFEAFIAGHCAASGEDYDVWMRLTLRPAFDEWVASRNRKGVEA